MENIRFISSTYVQPKNQTDHQLTKIESTPSDIQFLPIGHIEKGVLFHKPESDHEEDHSNEHILKLIEHLKASFSRTLDIFYPLAGRLAVTENDDGNTVSFSLDCNGAGAQFVHAAADDVTVADILDPVYVPDNIVYSLFLMSGVPNYEGTSKPLLAVQVTELVDGIFIGMTLNHSAADGTCFWNFLNTWSEISRSGTSKLAKPVFGREFLDGIIRLPIRVPFLQYQSLQEGKVSLPTEPLQQRVFRFRKEKIAELKSKANGQMDTSKISSLQALMGNLWVSITRVRRLISGANDDEESQETKYALLVGTRQRLNPPLPDQYLGNAVIFCFATSTVGEVLQGGLGFAAIELNKMIALQTEEVKKFLEGFAENPSLLKSSTLRTRNRMGTGSSPRFDVYGNDFGWGRPVAVRSGSGNKFDGKLTVFAGSEEGSIDFEVCLATQTLQALSEDAEFMKSVAVSPV